MTVERIEKIEGGKVVQHAARRKRDGMFICHPDGNNKVQKELSTLDQVADYLRTHPNSGVRMNPGFSKVVDDIHIDGVLR